MPEMTPEMQEQVNAAVAELRATAEEANKNLNDAREGLSATTEKLKKSEEAFVAKTAEIDELKADIDAQKSMAQVADEYNREPDAFCARFNKRNRLALYANEPGTAGRGLTTPEYIALENLKRSMLAATLQKPNQIPSPEMIIAKHLPDRDREIIQAMQKEPHLAAVINISTDAEGGFGVPDPVVAMVEMEADLSTNLVSMVQRRRINKPTEEIKMSIRGGAVRALEENTDGNDDLETNKDDSIRLGTLHVRLHKYGAVWRESEDSKLFITNNISEMAFMRYATEMRKLREKHILLGTGTGVAGDTQAVGLLTSTTAKRAITDVEVDDAPDEHWNKPREFETGFDGEWPHTGAGRDTAANRATTVDLLLKMANWMRGEYADGGVWLMNRREYAQLAQLRDGDGNYIMFRNFGLAGATHQEILGYPVVKSDYMPKRADDAYSVAFLNPQQAYCLVDIDGLRVTRESITRPDTERTYIRQWWGGVNTWGQAAHLLKFAA